MIKVFAVANLTKDVDLKVLQNGNPMATFNIAINRTYDKTKVDYFNCIAFSGLANTCKKFLRKGSKVGLMGTLQNRTYEKEGQKRTVTEIVLDTIDFIKTPSDGKEGEEPKQEVFEITDEDLPF